MVEAALKLVDEHGLDALSMRRLGAELGVDPMAIYYHVPGKRALLIALVESVFAHFPPAEPANDWQQQLRTWARTYRGLALRHPKLVLAVVGDPQAVAVAAGHAGPSLQAAIAAAGLSPADVTAAADLTVDYVNGFVLGEVAMPDHGDAAFERGLDIIVAGLERLTSPAD